MAQYEFDSASLLQAQEEFRDLADGLSTALDELKAVLDRWRDDPPELRRRLALTADSVSGAIAYAKRTGQIMEEIAEVYEQADSMAFEGGRHQPQQPDPPPDAKHPKARRPAGAIIFGDLIMPDWLCAAVIKYEQSLHNGA